MKFWLVLAIVAAFIAVYFVWVRPYLKSLPALSAAWQTEATTWAALKTYLDGRKTILAGMWGTILGWGPDVLQIISGVDLKTALSLPDNWAIIITGLLVPTLMLIFRSKAKAA